MQRHLDPIFLLADKLNTPRDNPLVQNALYLAQAAKNDLVVILERPSPNSHMQLDDGMVQTSETLQYIDKCLQAFSGGSRNITNTAVFDLFPLRTDQEQTQDLDMGGYQLQQRCDLLSYRAFAESVRLFHPQVVLVCTCKPGLESPFSQVFSSRMSQAGNVFSSSVLGYSMTVVWAFHPSNFLREERGSGQDAERLESRKEFDTCFKNAISPLRW